MSAQISTRMDGATMVVRVKGTDDAAAARKLAGQAAGTPFVGKAEPHDRGGFVVRVSDRALAARKVRGDVPPAVTFTEPATRKARKSTTTDTGAAERLAAEIARLQRELNALTGATTAPRAPRELPAFLAKAPVTCDTCRDLGYVRGVGANAGKPYRTADGVAAAKAAGRAVKCPSHKRASKSA